MSFGGQSGVLFIFGSSLYGIPAGKHCDDLRRRTALGQAGANPKKLVLAAVLILNIGCLAVLKFYGFTVSLLNAALQGLGVSGRLHVFDLLMPLGISYYTLTAAGYCIDVSRGRIEPEKTF